MTTDGVDDGPATPNRRRFLATVAAGAGVGLAGCLDRFENADASGPLSIGDFRGSGPLVEERPAPGGTSIEDLPDLDGSLTVYLGGGESGLYKDLVDLFQRTYPDFSVSYNPGSSSLLAQNVVEEVEGGVSSADVFWSIDAGSLGYVADAGAARALPSDVIDPVPDAFHQDTWVGVAGRARAVPYNTSELSGDDVPDSVSAFTDAAGLAGATGWAPSYGAFQSFVTAMRLLRGEDETRAWLRDMLEQDVSTYRDEYFVSQAVANGEIHAGFANHYYALQVRANAVSRDREPPIDLAFTEGDAGALVNVAGTQVIEGAQNRELAENFVHHLLTAEAQEFFATRTFAYPMIPGVAPVGGLPRIDDLNPPDLDLTELSDLQPTVDLLREVGVL